MNMFKCNKPCGNCPYRTDAPLKLWAKEEFIDLKNKENDTMGAVYGCHKKDGTVCRGWLIKQDEKYLPSIALRIALSQNNVTREYMDSLSSPKPLYETVDDMIKANYPEIL